MQYELEQFCRECQRLNLHFKNYGLYPGKQPVLFLDVSATIELLELQMAVRRTLSGFGQEMEGDYFEPGIWKPDCYLTTGFEPDRLNEAIHILNQEPLPFDGYLERIGLIKYYPAEQCYDYRLQE
nr:2'-5' RNA ligase family protein [Paenibacillus tepidiphilus]